ncbi:hypothetical protein [Burkholderia glumae]|uniref:hypothetical protein n=1 Tax=Burkholderia glumae TaxID=337 RepID=UPI002150F94B|nr:hypothetical protein [Burkholderia glumae]
MVVETTEGAGTSYRIGLESGYDDGSRSCIARQWYRGRDNGHASGRYYRAAGQRAAAWISPAVFGAPIRGQELEDYSGLRLEKRPDLTITRLSARPAINHNAMFYECKILGRGRTVDDYITHGVMRFQNGNYAWAMPHAGMVGYVVDDHRIDAKAALVERWDHAKSPAPCTPIVELTEDKSISPPIVISTHARGFTLRNGEAAGDIVLRHMWLSAPPVLVTP